MNNLTYDLTSDLDKYCNNCTVTPINLGDKYCDECLNSIVESMAVEFDQQYQVEQGWY